MWPHCNRLWQMFEQRTPVAWSCLITEVCICLETRRNIHDKASWQVMATQPSCLGLSEPVLVSPPREGSCSGKAQAGTGYGSYEDRWTQLPPALFAAELHQAISVPAAGQLLKQHWEQLSREAQRGPGKQITVGKVLTSWEQLLFLLLEEMFSAATIFYSKTSSECCTNIVWHPATKRAGGSPLS